MSHFSLTVIIENTDIDSIDQIVSPYEWSVFMEVCCLGGRYSNSIPLKNGGIAESYAKIKDIDFDIRDDLIKRAENRWANVVEGKIEGSCLLEMKENYLKMYKNKKKYKELYSSFFTSAVIGCYGWQSLEDMYGYGVSDLTLTAIENYKKLYYDIISKADPEHYLVVLDCHN